tara:strand:- start:77 stop:322 length:246 start_codon:yes stop_codon:yes gene_type:complete
MKIVPETLGGFTDSLKIPPNTAFMTDRERIEFEVLNGEIVPSNKKKSSFMDYIIIIMIVMGLMGAWVIFFMYKFIKAVEAA